MAGLVPAIHAIQQQPGERRCSESLGEPGHDEREGRFVDLTRNPPHNARQRRPS